MTRDDAARISDEGGDDAGAAGNVQPLRRDAARNRERLLEAAAEVFAEQGLQASVDDVARVAGVGMGTLYRRFPTKDALIDELVRELLTEVLADANEALQAPDGQGLRTFLYAVGMRQSSRLGCLPRMWNTQQHTELMADVRTQMAKLLADAQRHGQVHQDLVPEDISAVVWSLRGVIETTRTVAPDAWRRHLEIILRGMTPAGELTQQPLAKDDVERVVETFELHP